MIIREACEVLTILESANSDTKERLLSCGVIKTLKKGEFLFQDRENVKHFYFVIKGYVSLFKVNKKQDKKVIFVYGAGEMLNEIIVHEPIASVSCEALSEATILSVSREVFLEWLEVDKNLNKAVMDSLSVKVRRLYHQLANTSNMMYLEKQVAAKLWKLAKDFGIEQKEGIKIDFDLSITFLADMLGSKRESVSRIVKSLSQQELIKVEKNRFVVLDMEKLIYLVRNETK